MASTHDADIGIAVSTLAPVVALAEALDGTAYRDIVVTDAGLVGCTPMGRVVATLHGRGSVDLGSWRDSTAALVAAYRLAVAA